MTKIDIRYLIFFIIALILQVTIINYIQIFNWRPDLLLIVLVSFSLRRGVNLGMTAGFFVGLSQDLISTHFLGLAALSKTIAGFISGSLSNKFSPRTEFFLTLLITALVHDFVYFFIYTLGENFSLYSLIVKYTIFNMMYTLFLGAFFHYIVETWLNE